jgi:hypothetical protein
LNGQQTTAFLEALLDLPSPIADCAAFHIWWKLRAEAHGFVRDALSTPTHVNVTSQTLDDGLLLTRGHVELRISRWYVTRGKDWNFLDLAFCCISPRKFSKTSVPAHGPRSVRVPSQLALMQLPALRLFISHCGINSAHESLFFAKPLLCVPLFADQQDMAVRVVDSGAGRMVAKDQVCRGEGNGGNDFGQGREDAQG